MKVNVSRLDRRIDIERATIAQSDSGEPVMTWVPLATQRAASVDPVRGTERVNAPQWAAREQVDIYIRFSSLVADVNPKDRIIYPARPDGVSPVPEPGPGQVYDIISVSEVGRREWIKIVASRQAD